MGKERCSRCIIPSTYSGVRFNEDGVCSVCEGWDERWKARSFRGKRAEFLDFFKPRKTKYDCILPFSGGKDSSYVLYYLKRLLGLNPLAVNLNNYFQTPIIQENIDLVTRRLGVDLMTFAPDFGIWRELMRRCFRRSLIPCLPCDVGIYALAYRTALMTGTGVIVFPGGKLAAAKKPGRGAIMFRSLEQVVREFDRRGKPIDLSNFEITAEMIDRVKEVYFGDYFDWKEERVLRTVQKELGWKKKGEKHSRIDCIFEPIINYLYGKRLRASKQCTRLSSMVRDAQVSREEALKLDGDYMLTRVPPEFRTIMKQLGVKPSDLRRQVRNRGLLKPLWYN